MKRLNTLSRAYKPIAPNYRSIQTRTLSSKALLLRTPNESTLRTTSSSNLQPYRRHASTQTPDEYLRKTPLYEFHVANGAKMVPFSGFHMPVQYSSLSIAESHHFTRSHCSLFDVSHMVQHNFSGPGAVGFLEKITPAFLGELDDRGSLVDGALKKDTSTLSTLLLPETGGIVDDCIITRTENHKFHVVTNAGCREKDLKYLEEQLAAWKKQEGRRVNWKVLNHRGLIAIQGPKSADILTSIVVNEKSRETIASMSFGQSKIIRFTSASLGKIEQVHLLVSRAGYTGEDGFEISIPEEYMVAITKALLRAGDRNIALAGLGARDSLRLEAGMCLYGHDLDETVTPVEASLAWIIGKPRRETGGFHGDKVILSQMKSKSKGGTGVERRRVGIIVDGAPAREGAEIFAVADGGEKIGTVTSGCPSPTLQKNISMGYVKDGYHKAETEVDVLVRGKKRRGVVTKMPFVPTKYRKGLPL